jgi:hypothetical protein
MDVYEICGCRAKRQPHLDIWENQPTVGNATGSFCRDQPLVGFDTVIIGDTNGLNDGIAGFQFGKISLPRVSAFELVVVDGAGRMNMGVPSPPARARIGV